MSSKQSLPPFSVNCNKTLLNRKIFQFTPGNVLYRDFTKKIHGCDRLKIPKFSQHNIEQYAGTIRAVNCNISTFDLEFFLLAGLSSVVALEVYSSQNF
jgi:hypothetical protein